MAKNLFLAFSILCLIHSVSYSQITCCCGVVRELVFDGFDFEIAPDPPPTSSNLYCSGPFGSWTVTKSCVDHVGPFHYNASLGNPNGASNFVDLFGGPLGGPFQSGAIQYVLTGLTPGYIYTLEWYYAKFNIPTPQNIIGNVKVANGAWLNVTWKATNNGDAIWLKASHKFTAQASSTTLEFSDAGSTAPNWPSGMLIDDIKLFECPVDLENPIVNNPPVDFDVACDKDIPKPPTLDVSDNCDNNPTVTFYENTVINDPCHKNITRTWTIKDSCGNIQYEDQFISVIDNNPPQFETLPSNHSISCDKNVLKEFNDWIKNYGNAVVTDECMPITWQTKYNRLPGKSCESVQVEFIATDPCGQWSSAFAIFSVIDNTAPEFTKAPEDKTITCDQDMIAEFNDWIKNHGNAVAFDACGAFNWSVNYDSLLLKNCNIIRVEFLVKDICGNENSEVAFFSVIDTIAPQFIVKAESKNYTCISNSRDSLRNWLSTYGFSKTSTDCDTVILSSNFNGDSTQNPMFLTFYAKDRCGNVDSCVASFSYRTNKDTFRITNYSCSFSQNTIDTIPYQVNGCDSVVILEEIRLLPDSIYIQSNTCDPLQKLFDTISLINVSGCDSLIFNENTLLPIPITQIQKSDCAIVEYSIDTIYLSGQYCDSLIITEHFPLRKDNISIVQNTCDIRKVDTTIQFLTNSVGCDSIVTVYTLYIPQQLTFIENKVCGLAKAFVDTLTFTTSFCDSLVITNHISLPLDTTHVQSTTCNKLNVGTFTNHLTNQYGCDSLVVNEILLNPSDSILISKTTCDLSQSGINIQQLKNKFGCDSIVQTITNFIPSDTIQVTQQSCILSEAGSDTLVFAGTTCDSVVFRTTIFISSDTTQLTQTTCILANAGLSTTLLQNTFGCDSLILINTNYVPLHLNFVLDSISCANLNDGIFRILNSSDFSKPFELILNKNILGNQTQITNLGPGSYEIYVRDQKGCLTDSIQFTLINPEDLIIDLGNDLEVKKGTTINLNLQSNRTLQNIYWQPITLTNCINCSQINYTADDDTWIYTQAIDDRNCIQTDSLFIRVKKSGYVYAPNSFSPNGDQINDYFFIQGEVNAIVETLFIYDRWGNKVFETFNVPVNEPTSGWNGTFNNQKMNSAVFVYFAKVRLNDDSEVELKGDLTLIR